MNPDDAALQRALWAGAALLLVLVLVLLGLALAGTWRRWPARTAWRRWILGLGVLLPLLVLGALLVANLRQLAGERDAAPHDALVVGLTGRLWWWELLVHAGDGGPPVALANELVLPVGRPVRLALSSQDVIHALWIPALGVKVDLVPGRLQHLLLRLDAPGRWSAPCAEFCGEAHAGMVLQVRALPPREFEAWLANQRREAREPANDLQRRGRELFRARRCDACHTVRGVTVAALPGPDGGPDLTHLASRERLGAGTIVNDAAGLRAWITGVQRLKPGARMPSYAQLDDATLDAIVAWLGSLE